MVAFWISTFAPVFWMTVGIPLALANEPSRTMLEPVAPDPIGYGEPILDDPDESPRFEPSDHAFPSRL